MKKQYTKKQIEESIQYWKKQLNENVNIGSDDTIKNIVATINYYFGDISNAIEDASDEDYAVINRVIAWDDTGKGMGMAIKKLIEILGYDNEIKF